MPIIIRIVCKSLPLQLKSYEKTLQTLPMGRQGQALASTQACGSQARRLALHSVRTDGQTRSRSPDSGSDCSELGSRDQQFAVPVRSLSFGENAQRGWLAATVTGSESVAGFAAGKLSQTTSQKSPGPMSGRRSPSHGRVVVAINGLLMQRRIKLLIAIWFNHQKAETQPTSAA